MPAINATPEPNAQSVEPAVSFARIISVFLHVAHGFWSGETKSRAWWLTIGILAFTLGNMIAGIGVNQWNRFFFDALEKKDATSVTWGIGLILGLALFSAACSVGLTQTRMRMQIRWRQWLSRHLIQFWLAERRFYQLNIVDPKNNPEGRIAEDVRMAIEPLVDFSVGLVNALLVSIAYLSILWLVAGALEVSFGSVGIAIPGYMVWVAVIYSIIASTATFLVGRPLIALVGSKNGAEADLRFELTRVRESAENIAMIGGDEEERARLDDSLGKVILRWTGVIIQHARMTWILNSNSVLSPVVPLLCVAPKYLSGEMTLGAVVQVAAAFGQVQIALNWFVDNAIRLAEWTASAQRVVALRDSLQDLDDAIRNLSVDTIVLGDSPDANLRIEKLTVLQHDGRVMIGEAEAVIAPGEKVLLKGESGTGKSTLIRAIAGLWPWGSGSILRPVGARIAFLPQRPYIPPGTLRNALLYPDTGQKASDATLSDALDRCGLSHLAVRLDEEDQWDKILSGGEQQRLAFARLLVAPPDIVIMDEATAALDELSQARMLEFLRADLADSTVLSVGHRPGLEAYHNRTITLVREGGETSARTQESAKPIWRGLWRRERRDT